MTKTSEAPQIPLDGLASLGFYTANNRINSAGFEYDPAGNQTRAVINDSGTQQQYQYDCAGRLAQVLDANGNVGSLGIRVGDPYILFEKFFPRW